MHGPMHGGPRGQGWMSLLDTNKDGKLSKDEITARFDQLDGNKDGFLSQEELAAARAQFAGRPRMDTDGDALVSREEAKNSPMLSQNFDAIDANKDGQLSRDEMRAYHQAHRGEGWAQLDADKDGTISRDEAKVAPRLSSSFDALDVNKDGKLSRDEMRSAWAGRGHRHGPHMDANADGLISRDEAKSAPMLSQNFDAIDANKDGSLSRDEIHAWRRAQQPTANAPAVKP
jgi:Ca2+-binding EF-hand superfamily protein